MKEFRIPTNQQDGRPAEYIFSNEWFNEHTLANWEQHILPRKNQIKSYLEIGVCDGRSMCWMIDNVLSQHSNWTAYGIDPYISKSANREDWCADMAEQERRATHNLSWAKSVPVGSGECCHLWLIRERSQDWLKRQEHIEPGALDMVFIDGSHSAREAMEDMVLSFGLLRRGGIMVIDDLDRRWRRGAPSVWEAATGFMLAYEGITDWLYRDNRQWAVTRRK